MKTILLILLLPLSITALAQVDLGTRISGFKPYITDSTTFISLSQSEIKLCYKLLYKKVKYEVTLTRDRKIDYVGTSDPNFVSPEGLKVNSKFGDIANPTNAQPVASDLWWSKYFMLKSGWYAAFKAGRDVNSESKVLYFFKRKLR